jgi:hypothetical protein
MFKKMFPGDSNMQQVLGKLLLIEHSQEEFLVTPLFSSRFYYMLTSSISSPHIEN